MSAAAITWRPPGWQQIEDGVYPTPKECVDLEAAFKVAGYYCKGGALTPKGLKASDSDEAAAVRHNVKLLRDAWNTPGHIWQFAEGVTGVEFKVDPFNNPGTLALDKLVVALNGSGDQDNVNRPTNGLAVSETLVTLSRPHYDHASKEVVDREITLPEPLNWLGRGKTKLARGKAPAAVNGPHSDTVTWLKLCVAHGQHDICAAFVPDCGDGWLQDWGLTAQLVVRLGRVPCGAPPGLKASSPRGASALLVWVPQVLIPTLPKATQGCILKGKSFRVPLAVRPRAGIQYAFVQPGGVNAIVDMGLL